MLTNREFKTHIYEQFAEIGKALSSPVRLELIDLLSQGERTVEVLANSISQPIANTSQHLQTLLSAKIVKKRKTGNYVTYQLVNQEIYKLWQSLQKVGEVCLPEVKVSSKDFFSSTEEFKPMEHKDLLSLASSDDVIILDIRPLEEFNHCHIKGATSMPLDQLENSLSLLDKNKKIIAYCRGKYCVLSHEAVQLLNQHGYSAYRLPNSVFDWQEQGLPVEAKIA